MSARFYKVQTQIMSCRFWKLTRPSILRFLFFICLGFCTSTPLFAQIDPAEARASHEKMVKVLAEIAKEAVVDNPMIGNAAATQLAQKLEALPPNTPPEQRVTLLAALGEQELRLNQIDSGIRKLETSFSMLLAMNKKRPVKPRILAQYGYRLGVAYMRLGETQNCCLRRNSDSCIFPILGDGIHRDKTGSEKAFEMFSQVLRVAPEGTDLHLKSKWLLNIVAMTLGNYPANVPEGLRLDPKLYSAESPFPRFKNLGPEKAVDTFSLAGSAVADDFNNDGLIDVVASSFDPAEQIRFFVNKGNGRFEDATEKAGLTGILGGFNMMQADYDNDGFLDILVLRGGWFGPAGRIPESLLHNNGDGTFVDVGFASGIADTAYPTQAGAWADYDGDGDMDIYIGTEAHGNTNWPGRLMRNNGDGTFSDVTIAAGVTNNRFAKAVGWGDYDGDGKPDLYVSNLGTPNRLYHNLGDGKFEDTAPQLSVDEPLNSFPLWFWDFDNDGDLDLYVAGYDWKEGNLAAYVADRLGFPIESDRSILYRNLAGKGFEPVSNPGDLNDFSLPMGANYGDLDNDGFLDVYLGTGYPDYEALMPNVVYHNQAGTGFKDVTNASGLGHLQKGHGIALADFDNDGDLDVFEQMGGFLPGDKYGDAYFENPGSENDWIGIKVQGTNSNRDGFGTRIQITLSKAGEEIEIFRTVKTGGSFGASPLRQTIGLGKNVALKTVQITWPNGEQETIQGLAKNRYWLVLQGSGKGKPVD